MKRIGYIYKYSEIEKKGILVYNELGNKDNIVNLFSEQDCKKKVGTGQLVYFHIDNGIISNIERATLSSFDKNVMNDIITWKKDYYSSWYQCNTNISLYKLDNKLSSEISRRKEQEEVEEDDEFGLFNFNVDDLFDDCFSEWHFSSNNYETQEAGQTRNIDELFEYFGKNQLLYESFIGNDDISSVNILDISLWIDKEICKHKCFGEKAEELKYLYDIFIEKKRIDEKGDIITTERKNDCISKTWNLLLAKSPDQELRIIAQEMPIFQPVLPIKFCKKHLDILSEQYGMPNVAICQLYCKHKIENTNTASEYEYLSNRLYVYEHCETEHLKGEGVPFCKMGRKKIKELSEQLEERYNTIINNNIIQQFLSYTSKKEKNYLKKKKYSKEQILSIGEFLDCLETGHIDYRDDFLKKYADMPDDCQLLLKNKTRECINKAIIVEAKDENTSPFCLDIFIKQYSEWMDDKIKSEIKNLVNSRFANLDDLSELFEAYRYGFISEIQYCRKYKLLTLDYNIYKLVEELKDFHYYRSGQLLPLSIQWHIISRIIQFFNFVSLNPTHHVSLGYFELITDVRSLLKWIHNEKHINNIIKNKAKQHIIHKLNDNEKWILFEEGLISSPGKKIIRERLDKAYKCQSFSGTSFKKEFIQEIMYEDFFIYDDFNIKMCIADQLNSHYQHLLLDQVDGFLKLYIWFKNPDENFDWKLITTHFHELSEWEQLKLFRYIFFLKAAHKVNFTIDELYKKFVDTKKEVCFTIRGIIYLLKEIIHNPNFNINGDNLDIIIGKSNRESFVWSMKDFFHSCDGYKKLTCERKTYYPSHIGCVEKREIDGEQCYVVSFALTWEEIMGYPIKLNDYDPIPIARSFLESNFDCKLTGTAKYILPLSEERELKKFMLNYNIEDRCFFLNFKNKYYPYIFGTQIYETNNYNFCRCNIFCDIDPTYGIPFNWCNKKICIKPCQFFTPSILWKDFKFADFLYILLGMNKSNNQFIWTNVSVISQFLDDFFNIKQSAKYQYFLRILGEEQTSLIKTDNIDKKNVSSHPISRNNEVGTWNDKMSIVQVLDICYNENDIEDYQNEKDYYNNSFEPSTYDRYNGSYAQDVMGYSDDDIDTIFDGDPDAYWNID